MSLVVDELRAVGIPVRKPQETIAGGLIGTGLNLIWGFSPTLQTLDTGFGEHYHASLALFLSDEPVAHGMAAALLIPDIVTTNPFGLFDPEPQRSANLAIGLIEIGLLAAKHAWKKKR